MKATPIFDELVKTRGNVLAKRSLSGDTAWKPWNLELREAPNPKKVAKQIKAKKTPKAITAK